MAKKRLVTRNNPQLYQINTVAWLFELSQRWCQPITLSEVPLAEWRKLKELGTDFVWLMGVWRRSQYGRCIYRNLPDTVPVLNSVLPGWSEEDIIGSSYSIDGYEPDPLIGNWQDIDQARAKLNQLGIGLILDFIPNHTGPDHPWVSEHPEYYVQGSQEDYQKNPGAFFLMECHGETLYLAQGKDPYYLPWADTVQLNYFNPEARRTNIAELEKIAQHCDGVRCDMAMLMLNEIFCKNWAWANKNPTYKLPATEFWTEAISQVPDLIWIAEAYWDTERALQELGFDYIYDKVLYDRLRWGSAYDVYLYLTADTDFQMKLLRFIENHDELRSTEAFGRDRAEAAATVVATTPGMKLYHHGQLDGKRRKLILQLRRVRDEIPDNVTRAFYARLLTITNQDIFHNGIWKLKEILPVGLDNSFRNLIAYLWRSATQMKLIAVNLSPDFAQCRISLEHEVDADRNYRLIDELNDQSYERRGKDMVHPGLHIILGGYRAHIFDVSPLI